jgi:chromosome segregation ATPase
MSTGDSSITFSSIHVSALEDEVTRLKAERWELLLNACALENHLDRARSELRTAKSRIAELEQENASLREVESP